MKIDKHKNTKYRLIKYNNIGGTTIYFTIVITEYIRTQLAETIYECIDLFNRDVYINFNGFDIPDVYNILLDVKFEKLEDLLELVPEEFL